MLIKTYTFAAFLLNKTNDTEPLVYVNQLFI